MESVIILKVQRALAVGAAIVYFLVSLSRDKGRQMEAKRFSQILRAATAALMLPFGTVLAYGAYDPSALDWLQAGGYRLSFLIIGIGAMIHALIGLKDNWPR